VRYSINIPNFGDFADAESVGRVAAEAEAAGWDALFVWDHVVHRKRDRRTFGEPWMLLTAAALATTRWGRWSRRSRGAVRSRSRGRWRRSTT
jgi:hypothetical protein